MEANPADQIETHTWVPSGVDVTLPSAARVYDYYLGGFHNFEADRAMARQAIAMWPELPRIMRANRAFLQRAVTHLVSVGVRQFLDVGAGIPTAGSVHTIAQELAPDARVVYVDIDPVAVAHSQALLAGNDKAAGVRGDLRRPQDILSDPAVAELVDPSQPTALLLVAVLHFVGDDDEPADAIGTFRRLLAPGSHLVVSHATHEQLSGTRAEDHRALYRRTATPMTMRSRDEVVALFEGFDLLDPGVVLLEQWGPGALRDTGEDPRWCPAWAGVGTSR
jgi:SAM-dependent methyltransferase